MGGWWIALVLALWVVVFLLVVLVLGLVRKVATLEARVARPEREPAYVGGPLLGAAAPSAQGHEELMSRARSGRSWAVLFLSSSCGACRRLASELRTETRVGAADGEWFGRACNLIVVTDRNGADVYADVAADAIVVQTAGEVSRAWSVPATPFAVVINDQGLVCGSAFASTRDKLDALVQSIGSSEVEQSVLLGAGAADVPEQFL